MIKRTILSLSLSLLFCSKVFAVADTTMAAYEKLLAQLSDTILKSKTDMEKEAANIRFAKLLYDALRKEESIGYPFDSVKIVSKISPENNALRIFTWSLPKTDGTSFTFYGYIQLYRKTGFWFLSKRTVAKVIALKDRTADIPDPENTPKLGPEKWYGAYYYKVIYNSYRGKKYYTLLGWKGNDQQTTKKVIDNFTVNDEKIIFGNPLFRINKMTKSRMVFEFNYRVAMHLHYEEEAMAVNLFKPKNKKRRRERVTFEKLIVFDHIAPSTPAYEGQKQYYGPDLSYDALRFEKGKWVFYSTVDIRNQNKVVNSEKSKVIKSKQPKEGEDQFYRKYK
jgi:hypothetical protein